MGKFYNSIIRNSKLLKKQALEHAFRSFSKKELVVFFIFVAVLVFSTIAILQKINQSFMVSVPMRGGSISEGIVGTPRFINPALGFSDTDRDMMTLIYSGLMRKENSGRLIPDLAEKYEVSPDGLSYTFTLKEQLEFHNGSDVTAEDILFTINTIKDPLTKSPKKSNWDGVSVEKIDDRIIRFTLKQPYATFLENTTLGIMPAKLWSVSPVELNEFNIRPIGSGPYMISQVNKESSGSVNSYKLTQFKKFALGTPYLKNIDLRFYGNEEEMILALENGEVEQISSLTPKNADALKGKNFVIKSSVLPRIFGFFFNQNENQLFTDKKIIEAISLAINKDRIVNEVLGGYGIAIDDPIPPNMALYQKLNSKEKSGHEENLIKAQEILTKDGWSKGEDGFLQKTITNKDKKKNVTTLAFSISTGNAPELDQSAQLIKEDLTALGIKIEIKTFEVGNLNQSVIRPRKYDTLLFGQIINSASDLFAFWHSSQRNDPGLNVAMYTNARVDTILEEAFVSTKESDRIKKYAQFESEIKKDVPAVFLYSPSFIYVVSKNLQGLDIERINSPADRFSNVYAWYTDTDNVWKIFTKEEENN